MPRWVEVITTEKNDYQVRITRDDGGSFLYNRLYQNLSDSSLDRLEAVLRDKPCEVHFLGSKVGLFYELPKGVNW